MGVFSTPALPPTPPLPNDQRTGRHLHETVPSHQPPPAHPSHGHDAAPLVVLGADTMLPSTRPGGLNIPFSLKLLTCFAACILGGFVLGLVQLAMGFFVLHQVVLAIPLALVVWAVCVLVSSRRASAQLPNLPMSVGEAHGRLCVAGKPRRLVRFIRHCPVTDGAFEPIIFFTPRVVPLTGAPLLTAAAIAVLTVALCELLRESMLTSLPPISYTTAFAGIAAGVTFATLLFPVYTRIAPGRLDVMRFAPGSRCIQRVTINLRDAKVVAALNQWLVVKPAGPGAEWIPLDLRGTWNPAEFTHAVMRGAASSTPTPPLPDDQLTG